MLSHGPYHKSRSRGHWSHNRPQPIDELGLLLIWKYFSSYKHISTLHKNINTCITAVTKGQWTGIRKGAFQTPCYCRPHLTLTSVLILQLQEMHSTRQQVTNPAVQPHSLGLCPHVPDAQDMATLKHAALVYRFFWAVGTWKTASTVRGFRWTLPICLKMDLPQELNCHKALGVSSTRKDWLLSQDKGVEVNITPRQT